MTIAYHEDLRIFDIHTKHSSYVFGINSKGHLQHLHWGRPVDARGCAAMLMPRAYSSFDAEIERDTEEYGGLSGGSYAEPCLKVQFADGTRDLRLSYRGHRIEEDQQRLQIELADSHYKLRVEISYHIIANHDLLERQVRIYNDEAEPIVVDQAMAAAWSVQRLADYRVTYVAGRWAGEFQLRRQFLTEGKKVLESRKGFTSPHANPWVAVDNGHADETAGEVWFTALAWSGNWKLVLEKSVFGHVRFVGGINDFDSAFALAPGEAYASPVSIGGFSAEGFGGMSRKLHRYERQAVLPDCKPRRVLYNSWEATEFAVTVEGQTALAERAALLGVELFVVDDGWFSSRNHDRAGLGDWYVSPDKFPRGLNELIDKVKGLGMDFGIWVEPESVNPDSDLYRKHPDWVYRFPNREGTTMRNQLLLNLGKPEVKAFVLGFMTELLGSHDIRFIKWDMNRTVTEPGDTPFRDRLEQRIWLRHVENLYDIWAELRRRFPHVEFETCAGGGGRIDLGIFRYADQAWISDNTDARDRLTIQEGYSYAYTPAAMMCWVTESPHGFTRRVLPLSYRFHSAMMGGLGIGADISHWSEAELAEAAHYVALYKEIRPLVNDGDLYRLASFEQGNLSGALYTSVDRQEAVAFVFQQAEFFGALPHYIRLQGLAEQQLYEVRIDGGEPLTLRGANLMHIGIPLTFRSDFDSHLLRLKAVAEA